MTPSGRRLCRRGLRCPRRGGPGHSSHRHSYLYPCNDTVSRDGAPWGHLGLERLTDTREPLLPVGRWTPDVVDRTDSSSKVSWFRRLYLHDSVSDRWGHIGADRKAQRFGLHFRRVESSRGRPGRTGGSEATGRAGGSEVAGRTGGSETTGRTGGSEVVGRTGGSEVTGRAGGSETAGRTRVVRRRGWGPGSSGPYKRPRGRVGRGRGARRRTVPSGRRGRGGGVIHPKPTVPSPPITRG